MQALTVCAGPRTQPAMPGLPSDDESLRRPIARRRQPERIANARGVGPVVNDRSLHAFRKGRPSHAPSRSALDLVRHAWLLLERLVGTLEQGLDERASLRVSLRALPARSDTIDGAKCFRCPGCVIC
jgi:hypothetical protein